MQDLRIHEYKECVAPFCMKDPNIWIFGWAYLRKDNFLYLASSNDSQILIFDMENGTYEIKKIGNYSRGYVHMIYDGQFFWLAAGRENYVIQWEEKTGNTRKYAYPVKQEYGEGIWSFLLDKGSDILVCYGFEAEIVAINKKTGECSRCKGIKKGIEKIRRESAGGMDSFSAVDNIDEENALLVNWENCSVNLWNLETDMWRDIKCRISIDEMLEKERVQIEKYCLSKSVPYYLSEHVVSIAQFMDYIVSERTDAFKRIYEVYMGKTDGLTVGMTIHNMLKDENRML